MMSENKTIDYLYKLINRQGKYIEELEKQVAILQIDSHPPVFKQSQYKDLNSRLQVVEAWIDNIELIDKGDLN